jgi:HKD family nuclease
MGQQIVLSGVNAVEHGDSLRASLIEGRPQAVGVAAAFVSVEGVQHLIETLRRCGRPECRLIAGTDNAITHPEALYAARDEGWKVRLGRSYAGIFHPKLIVAGHSFNRAGVIKSLCCMYVGSSNLTGGGLSRNVECGYVANAESCLSSGSDVFAELWGSAFPANDAELRNYAARFAERTRRRTVAELADLGVNDSRTLPSGPKELRTQTPRRRPALGIGFAIAAWAGLQSFTGEYRLQVEFPRDAGKVISQLIPANIQSDGKLEVYCPDDEVTRPMQYRFYRDNGMFRFNIPNDVPGVAWAREHRDGLALVEQGPTGGAPLRIRILKPGAEAAEIVGRSAALGTWGKTPTRAYGWF